MATKNVYTPKYTEDQWCGKEIIIDDINYVGLPHFGGNNTPYIPQGFNPWIRGSLIVHTNNIPEFFNPIIEGNLTIKGLKFYPKDFNPQVSGKLYLPDLKSLYLKMLLEHPKTREFGINIINSL
jgi:hypothetical protein